MLLRKTGSLLGYTEPVFLVGPLDGSLLASFGLGWGVTVGAGLASYPLDTIRCACLQSKQYYEHTDNVYHSRRMMMSSGSGVHYKSMFDAGSQVRTMHKDPAVKISIKYADHRQGGY